MVDGSSHNRPITYIGHDSDVQAYLQESGNAHDRGSESCAHREARNVELTVKKESSELSYFIIVLGIDLTDSFRFERFRQGEDFGQERPSVYRRWSTFGR
jgi:hypothetical protein